VYGLRDRSTHGNPLYHLSRIDPVAIKNPKNNLKIFKTEIRKFLSRRKTANWLNDESYQHFIFQSQIQMTNKKLAKVIIIITKKYAENSLGVLTSQQ